MAFNRTAIALAACLGAGLAAAASAQDPQRLTRNVATTDAGSLVAKATLGNLAVDQYADIGRRIAATEPGPVREGTIAALRTFMCDMKGTGAFAADALRDALKILPKDQRASLKARDPASLTSLSITVLAHLDGVGADAIRADEAIGPGVYHDAINGMNASLETCQFFGLENRL